MRSAMFSATAREAVFTDSGCRVQYTILRFTGVLQADTLFDWGVNNENAKVYTHLRRKVQWHIFIRVKQSYQTTYYHFWHFLQSILNMKTWGRCRNFIGNSVNMMRVVHWYLLGSFDVHCEQSLAVALCCAGDAAHLREGRLRLQETHRCKMTYLLCIWILNEINLTRTKRQREFKLTVCCLVCWLMPSGPMTSSIVMFQLCCRHRTHTQICVNMVTRSQSSGV